MSETGGRSSTVGSARQNPKRNREEVKVNGSRPGLSRKGLVDTSGLEVQCELTVIGESSVPFNTEYCLRLVS